ncbi:MULTISPECIES: PaaI family thioesterase [unclassified Adlercreutzia]|uniref:PaaI family thioesterase n=1 Tax=unclassified Adlercreutzia TaxID=2636013 RepID=UPI0013ED84BB|nr:MULTISPECIES: PaaI family thioesterase [unclassified Adlercreutzia]
MIDENATLEELAAFFSGDKFATEAAGCRIVEARRGHAVCEMELVQGVHYNAMGGVMGGAIFTLADFALAVACNVGEAPTVSVSNTIEFLSGAKGTKLIATCDADKSGRRLGFYTVEVADDTGRKVAKMCATCAR